jgi:predicted metal-dependent hydrolase
VKPATPNAAEERSIQYGSETITYLLTSTARERLSISVHPDLRVTVVAPVGRSAEEVDGRVKARAPWIVKQRRAFEGYHPLPVARRCVSGESHRYLGRQYRLKLSRGDERVRLAGSYLYVALEDPSNAARVEALLSVWYRERALVTFRRRLDAVLRLAPSLAGHGPEIRVRRMTKRWGSCTRTGTIMLNHDLITAPVTCIDYVIMHELCHRRVMNHGPRFYRLLSRHMPDWERRRERLNAIAR